MTGEKAPFTRLFLDHVEAIPDPESLLFFAPRKGDRNEKGQKPLSARHVWEVIDMLTEEYSPYFRATCHDDLAQGQPTLHATA